MSVGMVPNRDEDAGTRQICRLACDEILEAGAGDDIIPENIFDGRVPDERDLLVLYRTVLHDLGSPELVAPMDDGDLAGELGQEGRFLHCTVAAADNNQFLPLEEEAVAGGTGRDSVPREARFVLYPNLNGRRAGGDDDGLRVDGLFSVNGDRERSLLKIYGCDIAGQELRAEPFRLSPHFLHEFRAHDALGKARVVFDFRRRGQLSPGLPAFNEQGREICPRCVDRGCQAGWAGTDDDDVAHGQKFNTRG